MQGKKLSISTYGCYAQYNSGSTFRKSSYNLQNKWFYGVDTAPPVRCQNFQAYGSSIHHIPKNARVKKIKSLLCSLNYAKACDEFAGPISTSLRPGNTAPFEEMSKQVYFLQRRAIGNTVSYLSGPEN